MSEGFLARAKADGKVFVKTVGLLSKISKAKLEIRAKQREKQQALTAVGGAIFNLYERFGERIDQTALDAIGKDFDKARSIDDELQKLEAEVARLKASFKTESGDEVVDEDKT